MFDLKINGVDIAVHPIEFRVTPLDLDDGETTTRTADGTLNRDRIAVKRQIDMRWNALKWSDISSILTAMQDTSFNFTYPDPMTGQYETKEFYVGNRPSHIPFTQDGELWWDGLQITLTEI